MILLIPFVFNMKLQSSKCIPFNENPENLNCIFSGNPAKHDVVFAKAY